MDTIKVHKIHKGQRGNQITAGVMDITIKVHEGQRKKKKSLQEWWRLLLKFTKDRAKKITAGVMEIICKGVGVGGGGVESLQEWWILPVKFTEGEVSKLVFYAQSTSVVISGRPKGQNNHSMDITCKEGKKNIPAGVMDITSQIH